MSESKKSQPTLVFRKFTYNDGRVNWSAETANERFVLKEDPREHGIPSNWEPTGAKTSAGKDVYMPAQETFETTIPEFHKVERQEESLVDAIFA